MENESEGNKGYNPDTDLRRFTEADRENLNRQDRYDAARKGTQGKPQENKRPHDFGGPFKRSNS